MKNKLMIFSILLTTSLIAGCGSNEVSSTPSSSSNNSSSESSHSTDSTPSSTIESSTISSSSSIEVDDGHFFEINDPELDDYCYYTNLQKSYLSEENESDLTQSKYGIGNKELSKPNKIEFSWYYEGPQTFKATLLGFNLYFDVNKDFSNPFVIDCGKTFAYEMTNFLFEQKYYWKVIAHTNVIDYESDVREFIVHNDYSTFRNIDIDGVTNCRDLGGYMVDATHRVRYGLVYRTAQLQENNDYAYVTELGKNQIINQLKIKTEIDLRLTRDITKVTPGILGDTIEYIACPMEWEYTLAKYSPIAYYPDNLVSTKKFFETVADESKLPLMFHCAIGTDRTGVLAFLLNGLLGVSEFEIHRDYLFSNSARLTSSESGNSRQLARLKATIETAVKELQGDTLAKKVERYLLNIGVSQQTIDAVRANMIEEI